jgi:hypothetical protein
LPFPIAPRGDAHDFCEAGSAFTRSKSQRRKRHKEKLYDVSHSLFYCEICKFPFTAQSYVSIA